MSRYVPFEGHRMTSEGHKVRQSWSKIFLIFVYQRHRGRLIAAVFGDTASF